MSQVANTGSSSAIPGKEFTMNSSKLALPASVTPQARPAFYWTLADMLVLAKCQLMRIPRSPQKLGSATLTPVLVLFRYVFGGAIAVPPGTSYVN